MNKTEYGSDEDDPNYAPLIGINELRASIQAKNVDSARI